MTKDSVEVTVFSFQGIKRIKPPPHRPKRSYTGSIGEDDIIKRFMRLQKRKYREKEYKMMIRRRPPFPLCNFSDYCDFQRLRKKKVICVWNSTCNQRRIP